LHSGFGFCQKNDTPAPEKIANSGSDFAPAPARSSTLLHRLHNGLIFTQTGYFFLSGNLSLYS